MTGAYDLGEVGGGRSFASYHWFRVGRARLVVSGGVGEQLSQSRREAPRRRRGPNEEQMRRPMMMFLAERLCRALSSR
jgi:hypothetical protein